MTNQEIYNKIEETYNTEKGKNFIIHLLRSFLPIHKSSKLMVNDKNLKLVDCITGEKLMDVNSHLKLLTDNSGMDAVMDNLKASAQAVVDGKDTYEIPEKVKELKSKLKPLAITCEKSDKLITQETLEQLFNFYASEILKGNSNLNWIANNERGKEYIKAGKKSGLIKNSREEKVIKKTAEHAKMSLGDLDVLQQLKNRMEKN